MEATPSRACSTHDWDDNHGTCRPTCTHGSTSRCTPAQCPVYNMASTAAINRDLCGCWFSAVLPEASIRASCSISQHGQCHCGSHAHGQPAFLSLGATCMPNPCPGPTGGCVGEHSTWCRRCDRGCCGDRTFFIPGNMAVEHAPAIMVCGLYSNCDQWY